MRDAWNTPDVQRMRKEAEAHARQILAKSPEAPMNPAFELAFRAGWQAGRQAGKNGNPESTPKWDWAKYREGLTSA